MVVTFECIGPDEYRPLAVTFECIGPNEYCPLAVTFECIGPNEKRPLDVSFECGGEYRPLAVVFVVEMIVFPQRCLLRPMHL